MDNKKVTKETYDAIAPQYYEEYKNDVTDLEYIDTFLKQCHSKILDLGCGMGHYSKYMKQQGFEICGVDFSKQMLDIARQTNQGISFIEADICHLPETLDKDFDGVLLAYVLQHLTKEEAKTVFMNLHQYISNPCYLLIFFIEGNKVRKEKEPFNPTFEYEVKEYTIKEMEELLTECGYQVLQIEVKKAQYDPYALGSKTMVLYAKNEEMCQ